MVVIKITQTGCDEMADREKVIKAVEDAFDLVHSDFIGTDDFNETEWEQNKADALELLKKQQKRIESLEIDIDILAKDINTNNCNTCKKQCEHRPEPGDVARVNCFMWEGD